MNDRAARISRFAASMVAIIVLIGVIPMGLLAATRRRFSSSNPLTEVPWPWQWSMGDALDALRSPLTDDAVVNLLVRSAVVIIWVSIAIIVFTTVFEAAHLVRHRGMTMPAIRGLGWAQPLARTLAAGLLVLIPLASPKASLADGRASPSVTPSETFDHGAGSAALLTSESGFRPSDEVGAGREVGGGRSVAQSLSSERPAPGLHVVQRGESVYGIAERLASDVAMTTADIADRILDSNLGMEMAGGQRFANPAYIEVGWELVIPAEVLPTARTAPSQRTTSLPSLPPSVEPHDDVVAHHRVAPGDTLSAIAAHYLGDPDAWPVVFDANAGRDMADGRTFTDPHLIIPGWMIDIPRIGDRPATEPAAEPAAEPDADTATDTRTEPATDTVSTTATSIATDTANPASAPSTTPNSSTAAPGPTAATTTPSSTTTAAPPTASRMPTTSIAAPSTTSTTIAAALAPDDPSSASSDGPSVPTAPAPIRVEHAALLAAGILALVGVRRRQRLRSALPRARVPDPPAAVMATERRLRTIDPGERSTRLDVALRAVADELVDSDAQIGLALLGPDGEIEVRLTEPAPLGPPWQRLDAAEQSWSLAASVPVEILGESARRVGTPCIALVQLGMADGRDVLIDVEACGTLSIEADPDQADEVVTAVAAGLATSPYAEVAHLITVSLPDVAVLGHRNAHHAASASAAIGLASTLAGRARPDDRSTFSLRSLRTGGEMWEPAIVLIATGDGRRAADLSASLPRPGGGIALVVASGPGGMAASPARLCAQSAGWTLTAFGQTLDLTPVGLTEPELIEVADMIEDANAPLIAEDPVWADEHRHDGPDDPGRAEPPSSGSEPHGAEGSDNVSDDPVPGERQSVDDDTDATHTDAAVSNGGTSLVADVAATASPVFVPRHHVILVRLMGGVDVVSIDGRPGSFERSKTVELIAWLATHRGSSTRTAARTALWELDVRDATFANVVSEARRALGRLVTPPGDDEWVARTLTEQLPLHAAVVTDADLVEERLAAARLQPPAEAIETLRPAAELIRDMPFAGTSYLWPDAEGITSNLVLLATAIATELAEYALSLGDTDLVFWATGQGLKVLGGHEELIGLRMRAHASAGDLASVRQEWESYERVIVADAWSDGEPAPKLLALRHALLTSPT